MNELDVRIEEITKDIRECEATIEREKEKIKVLAKDAKKLEKIKEELSVLM